MFFEAQGYAICENIVYCDNMSSMKLEQNGLASAGNWSRHLHIKYFFFTDQIEKGTIQIQYCPTDSMIAGYMTKPLVGRKFTYFRNIVHNLPTSNKQQECVGAVPNDNNTELSLACVEHNNEHPTKHPMQKMTTES